ncbi:MAG TPA: hypothetical protein VHM70_14885 [Polyangiaceae bacterium]|jgi:hypothetical protein|nr:hypothetical protein [Polyangiaceae bacterium]
MAFPILFTINDQPVKVVAPEGGGLVALCLNMTTGDWEPAPGLYDRYRRHDGDIDDLTEEQFNARVSEIRKDLGVPEF